jgi:hypothetical protein
VLDIPLNDHSQAVILDVFLKIKSSKLNKIKVVTK